ncbi:MAG: hypothetical protein J5529_05995 [Prevotella sp.]|nr:hypothetical protein [Prevotella sp.]
MTEQQMRAISIEELASSGKISRKTYNILVKAKMRNVFDLIRYKTGMTRLFRSATPCIREVNAIINEVEGKGRIAEMSSLLFPPEPEWSSGEELLANINEEQLEYLDEVYKSAVEKLAEKKERAAERLAKVLTALPAKYFIRDFLLEDDERFIMLSDVKESSLPYLDSIKEVMGKHIEEVRNNDISIHYKLFRLHAGGMLDNDAFALDYFNMHGRLPILHLLQKTILQNKENNIFKAFLQRYDIFGGKVEVDMTPVERSTFTITAYSNAVFDALFTPGKTMAPLGDFMEQMLADTANTSYLEKMMEGDFLGEDDPCLKRMIDDEHVLLTPKCLMAMMGKWMPQWLVCMGGYTRNLGSAMENRWKHTYLVRKELLDGVNIEKELWLFKDNVVELCKDRYALDMDDYAKERMCHLKYNGDMEAVNTMEIPAWVPVFKRIVTDELGLEMDENGDVLIPQKKDKSLADRLFIVLDESKRAMTLDQLTSSINSDGGRRYVRASVSQTLNKDDRFQGNGKKGWYALAAWQLPYFGSNIDIVCQLLKETGRPMRGDDIVAILSQFEYNKQFSKGDLSSVFINGKDKFVKPAPSIFGLAGVEYSEKALKEALKKKGREVTLIEPEVALSAPLPDEVLAAFAMEELSPEPAKVEAPAAPVEEAPAIPAEEEAPAAPVEETPAVPAEEEVPAAPVEEETPVIPAEEEVSATPVKEETIASQDVLEENLPEEEAILERDEEWEWMCANVMEFARQNGREPLEMFTAEVDLAAWLATQKEAMRQLKLSNDQCRKLLEIRDFLW